MTPVRLVPAGASRTRLAALALAVALPAAGAAGYWYGTHERAAGATAAEQPGARALAAAVQALAEARMALGLSEARSHELERQIDALNQRLRECQDELAFFRKAGERRH
jgi:hypothetical protein